MHQDPVVSQVKLIAEPWDLGEGGYQVGNFPAGWAEWNDRYRDAVRAYWKGDGGLIGELAFRLTGSSDLYASSGRRPYASINFVTAHDGFTLHDIVSYNDKHTQANGEESRDGTDKNLSWNCGAEGPTDDPAINALRAKQKRNFLATLLLSQGVPMLLAGDADGRTQQGHNNAYCQDNEISWVDWNLDFEDLRLLSFVQRVIALRKAHPAFRRRRFFQGRSIKGSAIKDILWLSPNGNELTDEEWQHSFARCLGLFLSGEGLDERDRQGRPVVDDSFLLLLNAHSDALPFRLPAVGKDAEWLLLIDTHRDQPPARDERLSAGTEFSLQARSLALLMQVARGREQ